MALGGGLGRVFRIGSQPVNVNAEGDYNIEAPSFGPDWTLCLQLLFPR